MSDRAAGKGDGDAADGSAPPGKPAADPRVAGDVPLPSSRTASQDLESQRLPLKFRGPALVFLVVFAAQLPFFRLWFNFMDEGHMVHFADIVVRGGEFYRDATFYPLPGSFYFLALIFKIFGASVVVSRWVVMIQFALMVALIFSFLRKQVSIRYAALSVVCMLLYRIWCFPHWHIYNYSTTSLLVLFLSMTVLLRYFETRNRRVLGLAGFIYGLGVLCKQDYGAAAFVALIITFVVYSRSGPRGERQPLASLLAWFFLPAALVGAVTGLHYWHVGILDELLRFSVFNHFVGMSSYRYMEFPDLYPLFGQDLAYRTKLALMGYMPGILFTTDWPVMRLTWLFTSTPFYDYVMKTFIFGPLLLVSGGAIRLWRRRAALGSTSPEQGQPEARQRYLGELVFLVFSAALLALVWLNKPQDYLHLAVLYWPLICLVIIYMSSALSGRRRATLITALVLLLPAASFVAYSGRLVWKFDRAHTDLIGGRSGIYAKPKEASMVSDVVQYMKENTAPGERVGAMPYFPIVNFLAERDGPHRSAYILWPFPELPNRDERIIQGMEDTKTNLVIYNFTQFFSFSPVWEHAPLLFEYLVDHFEIDRVFSHDAWGYKLVGLKRTTPGEGTAGERIIREGGAGAALSVAGVGPLRPVPPEARSTYLREMLWPFRPVIALRPSTGARRTVLSVPLSVPAEGGHIRTAIAVHPQWWFKLPPSWIEFKLVVKREDEREEIFRQRLNPTVDLDDRRWFELDLSLDPYAGQEVTLEFSNEAERPRGESLWMGGWAIPRFVTSSPAPTVELGKSP